MFMFDQTVPTTTNLMRAAMETAFDWQLAAIATADALSHPIMQMEFGKDFEVEQKDSNTYIPTVDEMHRQKKSRNAQRRRNTIHHAEKRLKLFKSMASPTYLADHPEMAVMGRYKNQRPYTHDDNLYISGFDIKKGHIRNRRQVVDIDSELAEYYEVKREEDEARAEAKRIHEEAIHRLEEAQACVATAIADEIIGQENAEEELDYLERRIKELKGQMAYHGYKMGQLESMQNGLKDLSEMSPTELAYIKYAVSNL